MPGQVCSVGVPMSLNILSNSSSFVEPGNRGRPVYISAMIHPMDQISIEVEYVLEPSNTSGARYHKVTTSLENVFTGMPKALGTISTDLFQEPQHLPCKSKVSQLELSTFVDEQILRLEIAMKDPIVVTEGYRFK